MEPPELQQIAHYAEWIAAKKILYPSLELYPSDRLLVTTKDTKPNIIVATGTLEGLIIWEKGAFEKPPLSTTTYPYLTHWFLQTILEHTGSLNVKSMTKTLYNMLVSGKPEYAHASESLRDTVVETIVNIENNNNTLY